MKVIGTHDEIENIKSRCDKCLCVNCVLYIYCCKEMFAETGEYKPILIAKGDDKSNE